MRGRWEMGGCKYVSVCSQRWICLFLSESLDKEPNGPRPAAAPNNCAHAQRASSRRNIDERERDADRRTNGSRRSHSLSDSS